jgi:hypothetical protein
MASALAYEQSDSVTDNDCDTRIHAAKAKLGKCMVNRIQIPLPEAARLALHRMLDVSP